MSNDARPVAPKTQIPEPLTPHEEGRLAALRRYELLGNDIEREFHDIVALVKTIFDIQFVAVTVIEYDTLWGVVAAGMPAYNCRRDEAFCNTTIRGNGPLRVDNATLDDRFKTNPFVVGEAHIRAYLGVPLTSPEGYNIGALCIFDTAPRRFSEADAAILDNFAKVVMSQIELRLVARVDSLTGMYTRRAFMEHLNTVKREAGSKSVLLLVDIDHFKAINDQYGHATGDQVLRQVANSIAGQLRKSDCLGRLGGEEFGVLLEGVDRHSGLQIAERIRMSVAQLPITELPGHNLTISLGLTEIEPGEAAISWLERSDLALYAAKNSGRNRCIIG